MTRERAADQPTLRLMTFTGEGLFRGSSRRGRWAGTADGRATFTVLTFDVAADRVARGYTAWRGEVEVAPAGSSWRRSSLTGDQVTADGTVIGAMLLPAGDRQLEATRIEVETAPLGVATPAVEPSTPGYAPATPVAGDTCGDAGHMGVNVTATPTAP